MAENENDTRKQDHPRRLLRSSKDRMLWGVAGGLGDYLRLDPTLVRLGFAVAAFFGGIGVIAYLVMAVVVPEDDGTGRPAHGRRPPVWAIALLAIAVLVALPGPFFGFHHGWGHGGWWGWWFGPLWFLFLIAVAIVAVRAVRGRPPWSGRGTRSEAAAEDAGEAPTAESSGEAPTEALGPGETAETEVHETRRRGGEPPRWVRLIAIVLLAIAAIGAAFMVGAVAAWATATGHGSVIAGVVIALGAAIAATAFIGEARRVGPWLLAGALVLGLPAGAIAAADIHFDGGIGERHYRPAAVSDLPADGYEFGVGQMVVDLRDLPWANGQTISVSSKLGIGQMIVSVPTKVCVDAHATGKAGELLVRGDQSDGIDPELDQGLPRSNAPRLDLDADIQVGQMIVTDQDPDDVEHGGHGFDYDHNRISADQQRQVCGR
jgi:phage shock protein PspC (stress-responsive transcriptional regulator)